MAGRRGLTNNERSILGFIVMAVIGVALYMATLPDDQRPPAYVYAILGGVVVVANLAKDQLGVMESAIAVKAKAVDRKAPTSMKFGDLGKDDIAPKETAVV